MFSNFFFFENRSVYEIMWENVVDPDRRQDACDLQAEYLRLQTHIQNVKYVLFLFCNNGYMNAPQCYTIRTLPLLFY